MIRVLDSAIAMKIAAGEVIERPASAIRELLDNSLDAGSTWISIHLEKGGREFLSVTDNGKGMPATDLNLAYLNHATSKISSFDDLMELKTFGFRGEALASLAEIAHLSISSRTTDSEFGNEITVRFGEPSEITPKGMNQGTTISVTEFFQNVPARLKFLGTDTGEYRAIVQEFLKKSLARPDVAFEITHNHEKKYHLNEALDLQCRIIDLFPELNQVLQPFSYQEDGIHAYGFVSEPSWYKSNRSYQYLFVNGRAIEWVPFRQQITVAYSNLLPPSKFPAVFCYIEVDPQRIDYNVHPQKKEIRFENEQIVANVVRRAIRKGIENSSFYYESISDPQDENIPQAPNKQIIFPKSRDLVPHYQDISRPHTYSSTSSKHPTFIPNNHNRIPVHQMEKLFGQSQQNAISMAELLLESQYIGTCFHTYLIFEHKEQLYLVDFHAMHERIRYDKLIAQQDQQLESQLIIPFVFQIAKHEADSFESKETFLSRIGFQMHRIGEQSFSVDGIPALIEYGSAEQILIEIFSAEEGMTIPWDEACKMIACKGSVRSGDKLSIGEVTALIHLWKDQQSPPSCPHGRPIVVTLDKGFLDKEFKRTGF